VLVLYGVSVVLGVVALGLTYASSSQATWTLVALSGVAYLVLRRLGYVSLEKAQRVLGDRRRNLELRAAVRRLGERLRAAPDVEAVWGCVRDAAEPLGASAIGLRLEGGEERSQGFVAAAPDLLRARYGLLPERPGESCLEIGWTDGRETVERDTEIAIELLCDHLSAALERLGRAPGALADVVSLRG
jgi:UDP-GlcNAc:undecaprenyl-phosphate GlcNAc-1-phosphate transferase